MTETAATFGQRRPVVLVMVAALLVGATTWAPTRTGTSEEVRLASTCPDAGTVPGLDPENQQLLDDAEPSVERDGDGRSNYWPYTLGYGDMKKLLEAKP